jgi:plasmid rolling circle replication initiator protein Rep
MSDTTLSTDSSAVNTGLQKSIIKITEKKRLTYRLAQLYDAVDTRKSARLRSCGSSLLFADGALLDAAFCQLRLCPLCAWRKAHRQYRDVLRVLAEKDFDGVSFVFLTLTVKNCTSDALEGTIRLLLASLRTFTNPHGLFRTHFLGTFRALEVTFSPASDTYHPHLHVLAAVPESYFLPDSEAYVSHDLLKKRWRSALGVDYDPRVHIERVRGEQRKAVAEVSKYTVKAASISSTDVLRTLDRALARKRLTAYTGLLKAVASRLAISDEAAFSAEDYETLRADPAIVKVLYRWHIGAWVYKIAPIPGEGVQGG